MRQMWLRSHLLACGLSFFAMLSVARAEDKPAAQGAGHAKEAHGPKIVEYVASIDHDKKKFDPANPADMDALVKHLRAGEVDELEGMREMPNPMKIVADLGLWSLVIFVVLLLVLRKMAWGPMLEGLQKREEVIRNSVEEAKKARAETERISLEFQSKMDQAYAEIPKIMEQARKDADAFKEDMRTQTAKDIQAERLRLRREIETARDQALQELWNQAAQLATLISAKAIGRSLTEDDHRRLMDEAIQELGQAAPPALRDIMPETNAREEQHDQADVSARRIAKVYATALLDTASKHGEADTVMAELESLVRDVFEKEPRLEVLLSSAAVGRHARHATLEKIFAGRSSATFTNFVYVLNDHERLNLLRPILSAATELSHRRNRRLRVFVTSAVALPDDVRARLETNVRAHFDLEPVLTARVDPALLGGLKVRIGDMQYDATVLNRLDTIRDQILARSSHEIQSRRDRFSTGQ